MKTTKPKDRICKMCDAPVIGRSDKIYCSDTCKALYHNKLKAITNKATLRVDKILHRNRSTLYEIMGENAKRKTVSKEVLDSKPFWYEYMTGFYENAQGKRYHVVYDFAWMKFSDGRYLIIRRDN